MSTGNKTSAKKGCVSPEIREAAKTISELKGEDLDALEAKFIMDYVHDNLHYLTEKARLTMLSK